MAALAPPSAVRLCNRAFSAIEHVGFRDFNDGTQEAEHAAEAYDAARRTTLEALDWRFASGFHLLPEEVPPSPGPVGLRPFLLPERILRVRELPNVPDAAWRVEGGRIFAATSAPLLIRATMDEEDAARFPAPFEAAFVYQLAHLFAPRWTTSANRAESMLALFERAIEAAAVEESRGSSLPRWTEPGADWVAEASR